MEVDDESRPQSPELIPCPCSPSYSPIYSPSICSTHETYEPIQTKSPPKKRRQILNYPLPKFCFDIEYVIYWANLFCDFWLIFTKLKGLNPSQRMSLKWTHFKIWNFPNCRLRLSLVLLMSTRHAKEAWVQPGKYRIWWKQSLMHSVTVLRQKCLRSSMSNVMQD